MNLISLTSLISQNSLRSLISITRHDKPDKSKVCLASVEGAVIQAIGSTDFEDGFT